MFKKETYDKIGNAGFAFVNKGLNAVVPILLLPISTNLFGLNEFAKLVYYQSLIGLVIVMSDYGFSITGIKESARVHKDKTAINRLFNQIKFIKLILLLAGAIALVIYLKYNTNKLDAAQDAWLFLFVFLSLSMQSLIPNWLYQGIRENKMAALINLISKLVLGLLLYWIVLRSTHIYTVPLIEFIAFSVAFLLSFIHLYKTFRLSIYIPRWEDMRAMFFSGFDFFIILLIYWVINGGVIVITERYVTAEELAFFAILMRISYYSFALFQPLIHSIIPYFTEKFMESAAAGISYYRKIFPLYFLATGCAMLTIGYSMEFILEKAFDPSIVAYFQTHKQIPYVLLGWIYLHLINNFTANAVLLSNQKEHVFRKAQLLNGLTVLTGVFLLLPGFLSLGAGMAMMLGECLFTIFIFRHSYRYMIFKTVPV
jgi:polysaccharide transporter, PST family